MAVSKFFLVYVYATEYIKTKNTRKILKDIEVFSKGYLIILFVFSLVNQIVDIGMDSEYRGVIKTYLFILKESSYIGEALN